MGAEVVMTAAVCGPCGKEKAHQTVEWSVAPGGVGQFLGIGKRVGFDWLLNCHTTPQKITNTYAVSSTTLHKTLLNRGTETNIDDVPVEKGQTWVTVSSPIEGVSHVTAFVPNVHEWAVRQQTSMIYWIDAEWVLPPPAINPAGTRHVFTTTLTRHTNHCPLAGWRVRYEITGGPAAGFAPDGAQTIEVVSDALGQARAEIFQTRAAPGTNTVNVQVIRPGDWPGGDGMRLVVGSGTTQKTWSSPDLSIRAIAPSQGSLGATLTYRFEVRNAGNTSVKEAIVTYPVPSGLTLLATNPPAQQTAATTANRLADLQPGVANPNQPTSNLVWRLGDLQPGETRTVQANFRADRQGSITSCVTLQTAAGHVVQDCTTTTIATPMLDVAVTGPETALVGSEVTFNATITNRSDAPATGLVVVDRFDPGLKHAVSANPIERDMPDLQPGQSRVITIKFQAISPGQQCNTVEVNGVGGLKAAGQACVTVVAQAVPTPTQPPPTAAPVPTGPPPVFSVTKTGPTQKNVGDTAEFVIEITNTGPTQANNLKIADNYDLSLDPVGATDGYSFAGDDLIWIVDILPPGKMIRFQVNCRCLTVAPNACNRVTVTCQEGARGDAQACLAIGGGGAQPLGMTVADLRDPLAVGNETTYEIRVTNPNSVSDRDVRLTVNIPTQMNPSAVGTSGPASYTIEGQVVTFAPVPELQAGATLTYRVLAKGTVPGTGTVRADLSSANMAQPVSVQESSTVLANP